MPHDHGLVGVESSYFASTRSSPAPGGILAAAGRIPNTHGIGLESSGVELDARGYIKVDERLRTTAASVWAMGECAGSPQFTHVAFDDFRVVRDNLAGTSRFAHGRLIPYCAFIDPELARIGLDEATAKHQGIPIRVVTRGGRCRPH